jgi:hypothetical protein
MDDARIAELKRWRSEAVAAVEVARRELADAQKRINQNEQRLQLVDELLAVEGVPAPIAHASIELDSLLDVCEELMVSNGRPMHIRELHEALLARGVVIPGRGTEANLIVRLQRSEGRFVRVGRGMYAPQGLHIPAVKPVRVRRTARPRRAGRS